MTPPVFQIVESSVAVRAIFKDGSGPLRVFPFGQAPQGTALPYAVWSFAGGSPENYLGQTPDVDQFSVRMDVYALPSQGSSVLRAATQALRDAIEPAAHIVSWLGESTDPETKNLRFSFVADWWVNR